MAYELRSYQKYAVDFSVEHFLNPQKKGRNGIIILPTGSGKSIVIANIIKSINVPTLILQPSKEILVQNFEKYVSYGYYATVFSASLNSKQASMVTFATIGSIIKKLELFKHIRLILIDECHLVNPAEGQYLQLIQTLGVKTYGLTATPYRLYSNSFGNELRFLTRINGTPFKDVIYLVQNNKLFDAGYLAKLEYFSVKEKHYDVTRLVLNSKGTDYTDESVKKYNEQVNFADTVKQFIERLFKAGRKNILVFVRFREDARLVANYQGVAYIDGETDGATRDRILANFKKGLIKAVVNVGVLTTGFDFPELETVLIGRATMSLGLYYQIVGRGIRPHANKKSAYIVDLCGNIERFGRVEDLVIRKQLAGKNNNRELYYLTGIVNNVEKQLTNVIL